MAKTKRAPTRGAKKSTAKSGRSRAVAGAKGKDLASAWNRNRTEEKSRGVSDDIVPPGTYIGQVTNANGFVGDNGKPPAMAVNFTITKGEAEGSRVSIWQSADVERDPELDFFFGFMQDLGFPTNELEPSELPDLAKQLTEDKPRFKLSIVHREGKGNKKGQGPAGGLYQNVYLRGEAD